MTNFTTPPAPPPLTFNRAADLTYGTFCLICFSVGTSGNLASFLYFWSKKRDISSSVYMMVTVTDTAISMLALPVGISFLTARSPGLIFQNEHSCAGWSFLWGVAVRLSIFFVLCLCVTRTYSLMKPFSQQRITYLVVVVVIYILLQIGQWVGLSQQGAYYRFSSEIACCGMYLPPTADPAVYLFLEISTIVTFILPSFVVAGSCVLSAVMLHKTQGEGGQSEQQQSKNRATTTILLFALLYLVCNVPLVARLIIGTYSAFTEGVFFYDFFLWDTLFYYENATSTLLLATNSAVNPVLYFWRMPNVRRYTMSKVRGVLYSHHRGGVEMRHLSNKSSISDTRRGSAYSHLDNSSSIQYHGRKSTARCSQ